MGAGSGGGGGAIQADIDNLYLLDWLNRGAGLGLNLASRVTNSTGLTQPPRPFSPGVSPGKPFLLVDITPTMTGLLMCTFQLFVASTAASDVAQFQGFYAPSLTSITGGTLVAPGITAEPTSYASGTPVEVAVTVTPSFSALEATAVMCCTLAFPVQAVVNQRTAVVLQAISETNQAWNSALVVSVQVFEQPNRV